VKWPQAAGGNGVSEDAAAVPAPSLFPARQRGWRGAFSSRPKMELLWDSPAAAGHNRTTVFRAPLSSEGDRSAARALDSTLRQV
jgi:hypothetical protein